MLLVSPDCLSDLLPASHPFPSPLSPLAAPLLAAPRRPTTLDPARRLLSAPLPKSQPRRLHSTAPNSAGSCFSERLWRCNRAGDYSYQLSRAPSARPSFLSAPAPRRAGASCFAPLLRRTPQFSQLTHFRFRASPSAHIACKMSRDGKKGTASSSSGGAPPPPATRTRQQPARRGRASAPTSTSDVSNSPTAGPSTRQTRRRSLDPYARPPPRDDPAEQEQGREEGRVTEEPVREEVEDEEDVPAPTMDEAQLPTSEDLRDASPTDE